MNESSKRQVTFYMDKKDFDLFLSLYPNVTSNFLRRCVYGAINNQEFFKKVFFEIREGVKK